MAWLQTADVAAWLRDTAQPPANSPAELTRCCASAEVMAERCRPDLADDAGEFAPDSEVYQGAVMYAAKLLRRRNSPSGVETFGDTGIAFTAKYDPQIDQAFRIGAWLSPGVG